MTELNIWLKQMLLNEFDNVEAKEEWGNLIINGNTFMIGENTNPYLMYKYSVYWQVEGKNGSFPLGENYDSPLLRQIAIQKLGLIPKSNIKTEEKKIEEPKEEPEFSGGLFDFL